MCLGLPQESLFTYNVMSLCQEHRLRDILQISAATIVLLQATRWKQKLNPVECWRQDGYYILSAGFSSKSSSFAVLGNA